MKIHPQSLTYNPDTDLWSGAFGQQYVLSEAVPGSPLYIDVSKPLWKVEFQGNQHSIIWDVAFLRLPENVIEAARQACLVLIKKRTPGFLASVRLALDALADLQIPNFKTWADLSIDTWIHMWNTLRQDHLYTLRTLYRQIAVNSSDDVLLRRSMHIQTLKISGKTPLLRDVTAWDAKRGALNSGELEQMMRLLRQIPENESDKNHALRLLALVSLEIGKRPIQVLSIAADGLIEQGSSSASQFFLRIPGAKSRLGTPPQLWGISLTLGRDIQNFCQRPGVVILQKRFDRLFLYAGGNLERYGQISTSHANTSLVRYFTKLHDRGLLMTSRDGKTQPIHYTQYRGRHTYATHLAMAGAPIEQIMFSLEHNSPFSAQAYIDAVGEMMVSAIDGADRRLGNIFNNLNEIYFNGQVVEDIQKQPIILPDLSTITAPTVVGSCGRDTLTEGICHKHPFFACLNGCPQFLAWRQVDCQRMLTWVEGELSRWSSAEGHPERNALIEQFERLYQAILSLQKRIEEQA